MLKNILLGVGIFATLLSILIFSGKISVGGKDNTPQGEVLLWGTLPESQMNAIVQEFNPKVKTYAVRYVYVPETEFNQRLLEALASNIGPDMIMTPYQTILSQAKRIQPFPAASFGEKAFKDTYVDGASVLYTPEGALALPVSVEPMVLFYNRTLLSKHGIPNPPAFWDEVTAMTPSLTIRENGRFVESAISLGSPTTPYAKDIIMAIVTQLGQTPIVRTTNQLGETYLSVQANEPVTDGSTILPLATVNRFFTQFGDPGQTTYTWNQSEGNATDKFVGEKLAMYVGYAGELNTLKARNPRAEIEMTYLPQTKGYNTFSTGMRMHALATLRTSKNMSAAFAVESQFASSGVAPTISGIVGGVSPLRAYASTSGLNPVIARSMLVARGWYDSFDKETTAYTAAMISDIINYRYGVNDASSIFISRMRDLYSK